MLAEELRVGYHVSIREQVFVTTVVIPKIRELKYDEPIEVIGSRGKHRNASRISVHAFSVYCRQLEPEAYIKWLYQLNTIARIHDIPAGNIRSISTFLTENTPQVIFDMLKNAYHPDADLDLSIRQVIPELPERFDDKPCSEGGSGLVVDVFQPNWEPEPNIFNY
jgi:hypothetical protein